MNKKETAKKNDSGKKLKRWTGVLLGISLLCIIVCAVLYVIIYVIPQVSGSLKKTHIVQYDKFSISRQYDAILVREEQVYKANSGGSATHYVEENTKTRKNVKIMDIYGSGSDVDSYTSDISGVVSYYIDGKEIKYFPEMIDSIDPEDLIGEEIAPIVPENKKKNRIDKGDSIYKIVTSDTWYTVLFVPVEDAGFFFDGEKISLVFEDGKVAASVDHIVDRTSNYCLVVCKTSKFYKSYAALRQTSVDVVMQEYSGLIVPNSAIAEENDVLGVYVKNLSGDYIFTEITVLSSDEEKSVIKAGEKLAVYDEILRSKEDYN